MNTTSASFDLRDLVPPVPSTGTILLGTVGWDGEDVWYEQGTDGSEEDGYTLVRVQALQGSAFATKKADTGFSGKKILCHISDMMFRIPKKGDRVYVAIPAGCEGKDAAGVIFAYVRKSPFSQFDANRIKIDFADYDLLFKGRSVTLSDYSDNYITLGESAGIKMANSAGTLLSLKDDHCTAVASGAVQLLVGSNGSPASSWISIDTNASIGAGATGAKFNGSSGGATVFGSTCAIAGGSVSLGMGATPVSGVVWGPTGIAGVGSLTVFCSP